MGKRAKAHRHRARPEQAAATSAESAASLARRRRPARCACTVYGNARLTCLQASGDDGLIDPCPRSALPTSLPPPVGSPRRCRYGFRLSPCAAPTTPATDGASCRR
eukprot:4924896-Prymnesium_polylepis.1